MKFKFSQGIFIRNYMDVQMNLSIFRNFSKGKSYEIEKNRLKQNVPLTFRRNVGKELLFYDAKHQTCRYCFL